VSQNGIFVAENCQIPLVQVSSNFGQVTENMAFKSFSKSHLNVAWILHKNAQKLYFF